MTRKELNTNEFGEYYALYIAKVPAHLDLIEAYDSRSNIIIDFLDTLDSDKLLYRYAPDKWTIKEVYQHLIDTERVFAHRMFRIGRGDSTPLPGFDQNEYIEPSGANEKNLSVLHHEYQSTRANTATILKSISDDQLKFVGEASGFPLSARATAFIILGHEIWHMDIVKERYL